MTRACRIISADSHTVEPRDLWEKWLELNMPVSIHILLAAQQQKMGATNKGSVAIGASAFMYSMPIMVEWLR